MARRDTSRMPKVARRKEGYIDGVIEVVNW